MKPARFTITFFIIAIMMTAFTTVTKAQSIEGDWYGKATVGGAVLRINIHVKAAPDGFTSTWDSPDQNGFGLVSTTTLFKFPDFTFTYDEAGIKYNGKVNPEYSEIKGTLYQAGQEISILFGRTPIPAPENSPTPMNEK